MKIIIQSSSEETNTTTAKKHIIFEIFTVIGIICTFLTSLAGLYLGYLSWRSQREDSHLNMQISVDLMDNKTFSGMLHTLESSQLQVRVGGIYSLENLARANPRFYWPTVYVLTSYVKTYYPVSKGTFNQNERREDLQAIANFLSEGMYDVPHTDNDVVDLSYTSLSNVDFSSGKLAYANFEGSILNNINFNRADLLEANFSHTTLTYPKYYGSSLKEANFTGASLINPKFSAADLQNSKFGGTVFDFKDTDIVDRATFFEGTNLSGANFCDIFDPTTGKIMEKCASNLPCDIFREARVFDTTELPAGIIQRCHISVETDPQRIEDEKKIKEAIKANNPNLLPQGGSGRLIYKPISKYS